jgi:hypothetical protein
MYLASQAGRRRFEPGRPLHLMSPKFQKRSELKLDGRIIPQAQRSGINDTFYFLRSGAR